MVTEILLIVYEPVQIQTTAQIMRNLACSSFSAPLDSMSLVQTKHLEVISLI